VLTHPTLDQLQQLGLPGMARAFTELEANPSSAELSHAEWLALLLDREATERYDRRLRARLRYARLRHQAVVEDVDYRAPRGLDRTLFQSLAGGPLGSLLAAAPSDRDRGEPRGSTPPTPPCIRVRTRRFAGLSDRCRQ
jgi:hypothetical protein